MHLLNVVAVGLADIVQRDACMMTHTAKGNLGTSLSSLGCPCVMSPDAQDYVVRICR